MIQKINNNFAINSVLLLFSIVLIVFALDHPFYWDNVVQISVPAHWFYETNFNTFYLPGEIATGHPTYVGMYIALLWKLFGRSLAVCHWGLLPFVFGLLFQINQLLRNVGIDTKSGLVILLAFVLVDTTFLAQLSLITFDIIQLFFFFFCINLIIKNKQAVFAISYVFLVSISLRAAMMAAGVFVFNVLYDYFIKNKIHFKNYIKYAPGIITLFLFLLLFKLNNGWVIHNTVSHAWEESAETASVFQMVKNMGLFVWRLIDFGRVGVYAFFLLFLIKISIKKQFPDKTTHMLFLIAVSQFIIFFPIVINSQNAFGHRYLLPMMIPVLILVAYWVYHYLKLRTIWLTLLFALLLSGHFWLYPLKISQGWDATTLHWKYMKISQQMNTYLDENNISTTDIATFFPSNSSRYLTHLEEERIGYFQGAIFDSQYILYSNAFNVEDNVIDTLFMEDSHWSIVKKIEHGKVFISLYQENNYLRDQ